MYKIVFVQTKHFKNFFKNLEMLKKETLEVQEKAVFYPSQGQDIQLQKSLCPKKFVTSKSQRKSFTIFSKI